MKYRSAKRQDKLNYQWSYWLKCCHGNSANKDPCWCCEPEVHGSGTGRATRSEKLECI